MTQGLADPEELVGVSFIHHFVVGWIMYVVSGNCWLLDVENMDVGKGIVIGE